MAVRKTNVKKKKEVLLATLVGDVKSYGLKGKVFVKDVPVEVDIEMFKTCKKAKLNGENVFKCEKVSVEDKG